MKAPISPNEFARLRALYHYDILDTAAEQDFDDITLLASHICGTPIALISLVDENRQWFKSKIGVSESETPRDIAFCAHGILQEGVFEVEDTLTDARFANNPMVTGDSKIRFYAGSPLITSEGHALGMLCVKDRVPRELDPAQKAALQALSRQVVTQLELRSRMKELQQSEEKFRQLAENITDVFWMTSPDLQDTYYVSPAYEQIWGRSAARLYGHAQEWADAILPEDRAHVLATFGKLAADEPSVSTEFRIVRPDGSVRWILSRGFQVRDPAGKLIRITGVAKDITGRKKAETEAQRSKKRLRDLIDGVGPSIFVGLMTNEGILIECNRPALAAAGIKSEDVLGKPFVETHWWAGLLGAQEQLREAIARGALGEASRFDTQVRGPKGVFIDVDFSLQPLRDDTGEVVFLVPSASVITERKQAEAALGESKRFAESIAQSSTNIIYLFDLETSRNAYTNRSAAESLGYTQAQILEMGDHLLSTIIHPEDLERVSQHFSSFAEVSDNRVIDIEYRMMHANGETRWIWSRDTIFSRRENGTPWQIMGTAQDITDRKRTEMEREVVAEIVQGMITSRNLDELLALAQRSIGRLLYAENCFVALHEPRTDLIHFEFWIDHRDPVPPLQVFGKGLSTTDYVLRTGRPLLLTRELNRELVEDGELALSGSDSASWLGVPLRTLTHTIGVLAVQHYDKEDVYTERDLSFLCSVGDQIALAIERRQAEEKLKQSEERTRLIVASAHDAFVGMDSGGLVNDWNPKAEATFGWSREEAMGQPMHELIIPEKYRARHVEGLKHFLATGEGPVLNKLVEVSAIHRDGRQMPVEMMISPIRLGDSFVFSASVRDITERKRAEAELKETKEAAEAANRTKSEFLANMSHEIRTPMNGIIGMTELALDTNLTREQREYLGMVKVSAHSLLGLINNILDFSKIEAGKLELESIDFSLRDCVGELLQPMGIRANQKGLDLIAEIADDVPDQLRGDPLRLRQILVNLTDNAIKFTSHGQVVVKVVRQATPAGECHLRFSVSDTGIGIPSAKQGGIFEAFAQADNSTTRTHGGTGLGLAIASELVEKMHGKLRMESAVGKGTTFHFTAPFELVRGIQSLPLPVTDNPAATLEIFSLDGSDNESAAGLNILLAEDNEINRALATGILSKRGHSLIHATNGREALELATAGAFDLILMDVQMPEMDGFEATRRIREMEQVHQRPRTPIVAMTAYAMTGDRARCLDAGMDDYLSKPIGKTDLLNVVRRVSSGFFLDADSHLLVFSRSGSVDASPFRPGRGGEKLSPLAETVSTPESN